MSEEPNSETETRTAQAPRRELALRYVRWGAAAVLVIGYAVAAFVYRECIEATVFDGKGAVSAREVVCAPPTLTSASLLVLLLAVALLLWSDLSEVGVLGFTMKRRMERVETLTEDTNRRVDGLYNLVATTLEQSMSSSQQVFVGGFGKEYLDSEGAEQLEQQAEFALRHEGETGNGTGRYEELTDPELKLLLLARFQELEGLVGTRRAAGQGTRTKQQEAKEMARRRLERDDAEALRNIAAARNSVAHAQEISREAVIGALVEIKVVIPKAREYFEDALDALES